MAVSDLDNATRGPQGHEIESKPGLTEGQSRVCDTCRIRKCKCSNERPSCASCKDNGWQCTYSLKRKRPGPVPGTRRKKPTSGDGEDESRHTAIEFAGKHSPLNSYVKKQANTIETHTSSWYQNEVSSTRLGSSTYTEPRRPSGQDSQAPSPAESWPVNKDQSLAWFSQNIHLIILHYFEYLNAAYPIIDQYMFEQGHQDGRIPRFLLLAMASLAMRFMPSTETRIVDDKHRIGMAAHLAREASEELERRSELDMPTSIAEVQATLMLTLFAYTRKPGRRAWEQTGKLSRMAYASELHIVDEDYHQTDQQTHVAVLEDRNLRRNLWWTIWRLDSYAGIATGTPFNINPHDIATRLPGRPDGVEDHRITGDIPAIWKSFWVREEPQSSPTLRNMFVVANTLVRDSSMLARLMQSRKPHEAVVDNIQSKWHHIRQNTPTWFWNPQIDELFETPEAHRLRMEVLLQFNLLEVSGCFSPLSLVIRDKSVEKYDMDAGTRWQTIVAVGERVSNNFRHWRRSYFFKVEPFACFLAWMAAVIFKLEHCRLSDEDVMSRSYLENLGGVMETALSEFGSAWELATILSDSLQTVKALRSSNLPAQVLIKIMAGCFAPLNNKQSTLTSDLKPGPDFLDPMNASNTSAMQRLNVSSDDTCQLILPEDNIDPVSESQLLNLPKEILNFTFQSPFLDGIADQWQFTYP